LSDERRFVNNPFARALHPLPSRSFWARLALGIISVVGALVMAAALLLPLALVPGLIGGGARTGRWGMVAAGILVAAVYLLIAVAGVRKLVTRRRSRS
jgi:hypothetical protein